jgi:hypothetical protein
MLLAGATMARSSKPESLSRILSDAIRQLVELGLKGGRRASSLAAWMQRKKQE